MRWEPNRFAPVPPPPPHRPPSLWAGLTRGAAGRCPACGGGRLFAGYLRLAPECAVCGASLGALRADDAPPYFTIFLAGHLLLPGALWVERAWQPPMWVHMALWLPLFAAVCTLMLRPVKGAVVGWMMRLGITGTEQQGGVAAVAPARPPGAAGTGAASGRDRGHA
ncbi:DUF983 domain-containing protein [Caldovatus aquaticus]|uniref:DUF983 domain-containing protein n=1 Tax=Caldovatus aquaticus TaxID=2865671 RepID=A0ABS7EZG2_9PROT|nr:DUF983 domain-containing protein [Caldovatus aquaticus]MBW8268740.1 DUF983 domain-containing protein [Caldovatus aquaticus]